MTEYTTDERAGQIITRLRERDDVAHVSRYDYENKQIELILRPDDMERESTIIPSDILHILTGHGWHITHARYDTSGDYPRRTVMAGFERP